MYRISRVSAISTALKEFDDGNFDKANQMLRIISQSISTSKKGNAFSPYIDLKTKKEIALFRNLVKGLDDKKMNN